MVMTNKEKYNKKYGFAKGTSHSKSDIAKKTGISKSILDKVYDRGVGARKTNPQSVRSVKNPSVKPGGKSLKGKMSAEQWAMARVYAFVMKSPGTWGKADKDLADKVRASKKKSSKK